MSDTRPRAVAIVGAGITGLATAHRLTEIAHGDRTAIEIRLFEASQRAGGVISTVTRDGFLLEEGPDAFITDKPWARDLARRLGLADRLIGTQPEGRRSFVAWRGRLEPTPEGFHLLAPTRLLPFLSTRLLSPWGKARVAMDLVIPRRPGGADESVAGFVRRRLGREALERIAQPMIGGIYGADPEQLSLRATLPRFLQMEQTHGSVIRALLAATRARAGAEREAEASGPRYGLFSSFDGGLGVLTSTLVAALPRETIRTGCRVHRLGRGPAGNWLVTSSPGGGAERTEAFDAVIVALRASDASALLQPLDSSLAAELAAVPYDSAATLSLAFRRQDVEHPMDGFGFAVPAVEGLSIMGCTFVHRKFAGRAPEGHALLRVFWDDRSRGLSDTEIRDRTMADLKRLLGIRGEPLLEHLTRYAACMPRYVVGHLDRVDRIEKGARRHGGLALAGNAYRGLGIPDCVHSGEAAAESVARHLGLTAS